MQIANPIYDVVFKYLMEDNEVAKLIISTIIDEEIVELTFLPQESTAFIQHRSLTVYRLDFSAKIKHPDGSYKQVLIEIQKAKFAVDIMRFRRYLGQQYQDKNNGYQVVGKGGKTEQRATPIVTIYFLGYPLEQTTAPVIKVARHYYDVTTGKTLQTREQFIESLTHDSYVIQIPHLRPERQSQVEQLLTIFDQNRATRDAHLLNIPEADYPEAYQQVIRRLQSAVATPEVRRTMDAEDEILEALAMLEREVEEQKEVIKELKLEKDKALTEKDKALTEKDKALTEKDNALSEKDKLIAELQQRLKDAE